MWLLWVRMARRLASSLLFHWAMSRENLARIYHVDFEILEIQGKPLSIYY